MLQLLACLVNIVITSQFAKWQNQVYTARIGIATRLNSGVFLANICLDNFDSWLRGTCEQAQIPLALYVRCANDVQVLCKRRLLQTLSAFANS